MSDSEECTPQQFAPSVGLYILHLIFGKPKKEWYIYISHLLLSNQQSRVLGTVMSLQLLRSAVKRDLLVKLEAVLICV